MGGQPSPTFLKLFEASQVEMEILGKYGNFWEIFGKFWKFWKFWEFLEIGNFGELWGTLGNFGELWGTLDIFPQGLFPSQGNLWKTQGICGNGEFLGTKIPFPGKIHYLWEKFISPVYLEPIWDNWERNGRIVGKRGKFLLFGGYRHVIPHFLQNFMPYSIVLCNLLLLNFSAFPNFFSPLPFPLIHFFSIIDDSLLNPEPKF